MRVRITDVAAEAGVSPATVSVALNDVDGARVAPATRERIRTAAARLGYTPNNLARGLRTQRTHTIGLVSDHVVTTPYAGRMILGAQKAAWEAGFVLMLVSTGADERLERESLQSLIDRQVDGLIYASMYHRTVAPPNCSGCARASSWTPRFGMAHCRSSRRTRSAGGARPRGSSWPLVTGESRTCAMPTQSGPLSSARPATGEPCGRSAFRSTPPSSSQRRR